MLDLRPLYLIIIVLLLVFSSSRIIADDIAWTPEHDSNGCVNMSYSFPSSLVPVQDDQAATGGLSWHSFDQRYELSLETKATYYATQNLTSGEYNDLVVCGAANNVFSDTSKENRVISCEEGRNSIFFVVAGKNGYTASSFLIAPDDNDDSRFIAHFQLTGSLKDKVLVSSIMRKLFQSASLNYIGCCNADRHIIGCHWLEQ